MEYIFSDLIGFIVIRGIVTFFLLHYASTKLMPKFGINKFFN